MSSAANTSSESVHSKRSVLLPWVVVLLSGAFGVGLGAWAGFPPASQRLLGIFFATILGLVVEPMPGEAVVLTGITATVLFGVLPLQKALAGYSDPLVWLVLTACLLARGMTKSGLGRRIALLLIRALGKSSLGLGYAFVLSDVLLGSVVPSTTARTGGILFPIAKSLSETFDSRPGPTAKRIGAFLLTLMYQCDIVVCSLFLTGIVSNFLIAKFVKTVTGIDLTYGQWLLGAIVPAACSLVAIPLFLYTVFPPELKKTPEAPAFARAELEKIGPMSRDERWMASTFALVAGLWITESLHHINYTTVALLSISLLIISQVLTWQDIASEKTAWSIFVWYGGLITITAALQEFGITKHFAESVATLMQGKPWPLALSFLLAIYFYAHYGFASVTAHVAAMFVPFLNVSLATGAPVWVAVCLLGYFSNLCGSLTHYGTAPAPLYFSAGYVTQKEWWRNGFFASLINLTIWTGIGLVWWKFLGRW